MSVFRSININTITIPLHNRCEFQGFTYEDDDFNKKSFHLKELITKLNKEHKCSLEIKNKNVAFFYKIKEKRKECCLKGCNKTIVKRCNKIVLKACNKNRCSGCGVVRYCSKKHQKIDWKNTHRNYCKLFKNTQLYEACTIYMKIDSVTNTSSIRGLTYEKETIEQVITLAEKNYLSNKQEKHINKNRYCLKKGGSMAIRYENEIYAFKFKKLCKYEKITYIDKENQIKIFKEGKEKIERLKDCSNRLNKIHKIAEAFKNQMEVTLEAENGAALNFFE